MEKFYNVLTNKYLSLCVTFLLSLASVQGQVPNCATVVSPANGATLTRMATFSWTAPTGPAVTGYKFYLGTTSAATELVNGTTTITAPTVSYNYTFTTIAGSLIPGTTYYWKIVPYNGNGDAVGCTSQSFTITAAGDPTVFPVGSWNAYCYNSTNFTNYIGYYTATGVDFDSRTSWTTNNSPSNTVAAGGATTYLGGAIQSDNHSVSYKRQGFTPGTYTIDVLFDDECFAYLNGALIYTFNGWTSTYKTAVATVVLDANSQFEFRWREGTGGSNGSVKFTIGATPPTLVAGTIAGSQNLCSGNTNPTIFTSTLAGSGACGVISYQWQQDVGCTGTFTDIAGATAATYDAPAGVSSTTCFRRMTVDASCARSLASNTITVTVYTTAPGDPTVFPLNTWNGYVYDFTAVNGGVYSSADANWTDYKGYFTYAGVSPTDPSFSTTTIYTTVNVPSSVAGYQGCLVGANLSGIQMKRQGFPAGTYSLNFSSNDAGYLYVNGVLVYSRTTTGAVNNVWTGNLGASSTVEFRYKNNTTTATGDLTFNLIALPTLVAGTISGNQSLCYGSTDPAAFTSTLAASGTCSPVTYQWQNDVGCTGTFTDIVGATLATYDAPTGVSATTCYRRMVLDANCSRSLASNTITVTVYTTAPGDPSVFPANTWNGYVFDFSSTGGYNSNDLGWSQYRGYFTYPGVSAADPSFNTASIYSTANLPTSVAGYVGCSVASTNAVGVQFKRQGFPAGTYQIDYSSDDAGYVYINGSLVYSRTNAGTVINVWTGNLNASSTIDFHYKNSTGNASGVLTFTALVTPTLIPGTISFDQTLCPGNDPVAFTNVVGASGTCSPLKYQWQQDVGCTGTFTDIVGANLAAYDVPAGITQTTCYRRAVIDANCGRTDYTNTVTVTVTTVPQGDPTVFPSNTWNGYVYDFNVVGYGGGADAGWTDYKGFFSYPGVSASDPSFNTSTFYAIGSVPSSVQNYAGCQIGGSLNGVQMKRQGFPAGTYRIDFNSDDAGYLYVNGVLVYGRTGCCALVNNVWTGNLDANSTIDYRYKNNGSGGYGVLTFTLVTPTIPLNEGAIALNGPGTICAGNTPTPIVSTQDAVSSCYLYYQWQADEGTGYQDVVGATNTAYTPTSVLVETSYRRKISDACGDVSYSNVVTIFIGPAVVPDASIFGNNSWIAYVYNQPNFVAASLYGSYTDPGASTTDASFNSENLWGKSSAPSLASNYVGCQVGVDNHSVIYKRQGFTTGTYSLSIINDDACQLYVNNVLVYSRGSWTPTFINSVWVGDLDATSTIEFRWTEGGVSSNGGVTFTKITTPTPLNGGTITTTATQVCAGDITNPFTSTSLPSGGCSVSSYQWQLDNGSGFTDIVGATNVTFTPTATQSVSTSYRRKVIDACAQIGYSNTVVVGIGIPTPPDPSIFGSNVWNVYAYNDVTFTTLRGSYVDNGFSASDPSFDSRNKWVIAASPSAVASYSGCDVAIDQHGVIYKRQGFPTGIYRLDYNSDDAGSVYINGVLVYTSVSWGALVTNIWTGPLDASSTIEYRWADTGGSQSYGSLLMTHPVTPTPLVAGAIANASTIVCSGNAPAAFTSAAAASGGCYPNYQWQLSTTAPGTTGFADIAGATAVTYASPATISATTYYRRKVTDACGTVEYSNVVTITVGVPSPPDPSIFGSNVWNAYVYDGNNFNTLFGMYVDNGISTSNPSFDTRLLWATATRPSLAPGYTGCQVGDDNHSVIYKRQGFDPGIYQIDFDSDNFGYVYVNGTLVYSRTVGCCAVVNNVWTGVLNASSTVEYRFRETTGNSYGFLRLTSTTPPALLAGAIGSDQIICDNVVPATLTSVADATSGCTITYQWQYSTVSATGPWTNTGGNNSTLAFTPPGLTQTRYYVRNATDACGRSVSSNVVTVTVNPKPNNAGAITGLASVCSAQAGVTYSIPAVVNATTYTWTLPAGAVITSGDGTNSIVVTFGSTSGTITVRPENTCGVGLISSLSVAVTPAIPANAGAISGLTTVCSGQYNVLYSVPPVTDAATYIWTIPAGASIISGANTNAVRITFGATSGDITVTPSNSCGSALAATSLAITVNPLPSNAGVITGNGSYCPNETGVAFSIAAVANATSYSWLLPSGSTIATGVGTNSITVNFGSSSGNITVTPTNTCGTGTATIKAVAVKSLGAAGAISGLANVCQNTTGVTYSISTVTGASNYVWTVPSGSIITGGNGTRNITVTMGTVSGTVTVTPSNSCQTGSTVSLPVIVTNTIPNAAGAITGNNNPCAAGTGISYSIASVTGATNYIWSLPSGSVIATGATTNAITVNFASTNGNIIVTPNNVCGNSANALVAVTLKPLPASVGAISGATAVCKETGVAYSISSVANALTYTWSVPTGAVITSGVGTTSIIVSYAGASVSSGAVSVIAGNTCSTTSNSVTVSINSSCANTWTGASTIDWHTTTNWNLGVIPTSADDVTIPSTVASGRMPTISTAANAKSVTNSGTITFTSAGALNVTGSISNTGTVTPVAGSTLAFVGSTAQSITGVPVLYNVTINNTSGGVSLGSAVTVRATLSLTNGVLTTNSNLTINFDNGGNIGYNSSDLGSISGNVSGRRDVGAKTHYIAVPFSGVTSAQVQATTPLYVNTFWKMYTKDFTNQNWTAVINATTSMPQGTGFSLSLPSAAPLIFTGAYNHAYSFTGPTYSNAAANKYLMVGNPYPSTIDWSAASGWSKTNVANAIYFWDPANSRSASYVAGVGTNGATRYIPAMQSVLVTTTGGGGSSSISMTNDVRISSQNPSYFRVASDEIVRLTLTGSDATKSDEAVIRFNEMATDSFDYELDAHKILNTGVIPSVYTTSGADTYSINSYASVDSAQYIPVGAKLPVDGAYTLKISGTNPNVDYVLVDKQLGTQRSIAADSSYAFTGFKTDDVNRFELQLRVSATTVPTGIQSANKNSGLGIYSSSKGFVIKTDRYAGEEAEIEILDVTGNSIKVLSGKNLSIGSTYIPLDMPDGSYLVKVNVEGNIFAGMIVLVK